MTRLAIDGIRRSLVVGLGVTGGAVAEALILEGVEVVVSDASDGPTQRGRAGRLFEMGVEVRLGGHDPELVDWADLVVPSKGVPPSNPLIAAALRRGKRVWSEFELAYRLMERIAGAKILAITGTNGKTTTTTLLSKILVTSGLPAIAAGNLPVPLVEAVRLAPQRVSSMFVCEASSFGLAFIERFRAEVAVVLNVADDHYDWHSGYSDYLDAKARITENQTSRDLLAIEAFDAGSLEIARRSGASLAAFAPAPIEEVRAAAELALGRTASILGGMSGDLLVVDWKGEQLDLVSIADIRLRGRHNLDNVLAASIAALEMGVEVKDIERTVAAFEGLPHRMSFVAEKEGVRYIDDSKSTNTQSTLKALEGLERVVLIAGGDPKGLDLTPLSRIKGDLSGVVVMGSAASQLERVFAGIPLRRASDVEEAVEAAASLAGPGHTVLLSPACSSVDQYSSYAERGERFAKAVMKL